MPAELATGYVTLVPSAKGFASAIESELGGDLVKAGGKLGEDTSKHFGSKFSSGMKTVAKAGALAFAGAAGAAIVGGKAAIDAASDQEESLSKVRVVFGESAAEIEKWADGAAKGFGQSKSAALESVGTYGNLLQAFGLSGDAAKDMSVDMVQLASDLASFNNTSVEDALGALQSGLSGESEPLKRYGVALSDVRLREEALAQGLIKSTKDAMSPAIKAQATYGLVLKDTKLAQGDFARTSDGLANSQRIQAAQFDNIKASIGKGLMPVMQALTPIIAKLATWLGDNLPGAIAATQKFFEEKLIPAVKETARWINDNLVPAAKAIIDGFREAFTWIRENVIPVIGAIVEFVATNWPQIQDVIVGVIDFVRGYIEGFVKFIQDLWKTWGDEIKAVAKAAWEAVQLIVDGVTKAIEVIVDNFGKEIVAFLKSAFDAGKAIVEGVINAIRAVIKTVTDLITGDWKGAWQGIKDFVQAIWDAIKGVIKAQIDAVKAILSAAWDAIKLAVSGAWEGIKTLVSNGIDAVVNFVKGLPQRVVDALSSLARMLRTVVNTAFEGAKEVAGNAIDAVVDFVKSLPGRLVDLISSVGDAARRLGSAILNGIKGAAGDVASAVLGAFRTGMRNGIQALNDAIPNSIPIRLNIPFLGERGFDIPFPDNPIPNPFHTGGVVPGSAGQEVAAILQAGEVVLTGNQQRALIGALTRGGEYASGVVINGDIVAADPRAVFAELDRREWRDRRAKAHA